MTGTEHCNKDRRTLSPLNSPTAKFPGHRINALKRAALGLPVGVGCSQRPFPRLQRLRSLSGSIPGSTFPACCFASTRKLPLPGPPSAPSPIPVCTRDRPPQCFRPVAASTSGPACRPPRPPLPVRTVTSFRIKAFCRSAASQPAFRTRPISVRSPLPSVYC
jgi:hypothetical protein